MKKLLLSALPGLAATLVCFGTLAVAQPPDRESTERPRAEGKPEERPEGWTERSREGRPAGRPEGRRGPLGGGPGPMFRPGMILPPFVAEQLDLSADQQEKLEALQSEVRAQLDKILTADQKNQLRVMAERGPMGRMMPGGGPGGPGFGRGPGRERPEGAGPGEPRRRDREAGEPRRRDGEERARPERPRRPDQAERGERAGRPERAQPEREAAEKADKPEAEKPDADQ